MARWIIGFLALALCMGQNCSSSILNAIGSTDGTTDSGDTTDVVVVDPDRGIPEGTYSGSETINYSLDNLNDAYPAETSTSQVTIPATFNAVGELQWSNGKQAALNDIIYTDTDLGRVYETINTITIGTKLYEYRTTCQLQSQGQGDLVWNFTGEGVHTYRLSGGKVLYEGEVSMTSDTSGGASYRADWSFSATLEE